MLDHDEERQLAEIEAHLLEESPEWHELFDRSVAPPDSEPGTGRTTYDRSPSPPGRDQGGPGGPDPRPHLLGRIVRSFVAIALAIVVTAATTVVAGPDAGGFVAVVAFCAAGMYGYQILRGCPGVRRSRGQA